MWSAIVMGAIALGTSLIKAGVDKNTAEQMVQEQYKMTEAQQAEYAQAKAETTALYEPEMAIGQQGLNELGNYDDSSLYNRADYSNDATIEDYMNPYQDYARTQAMKDIEQSASTTGGTGSGATLKALQDRSQGLSEGYYNTAYAQKTADDATKYSRYTDKFNQDKALLDSQYNQIMNKVNLGTNAKNAINGAINQNASGQISTLGTQGDLSAINAQAQGNFASDVVSGIGSGLGTGLGIYDQASSANASIANQANIEAQQAAATQAAADSAAAAASMASYGENSVYNPTTGLYTPTVSSGNMSTPNTNMAGYTPNADQYAIDYRSIYGGQ